MTYKTHTERGQTEVQKNNIHEQSGKITNIKEYFLKNQTTNLYRQSITKELSKSFQYEA